MAPGELLATTEGKERSFSPADRCFAAAGALSFSQCLTQTETDRSNLSLNQSEMIRSAIEDTNITLHCPRMPDRKSSIQVRWKTVLSDENKFVWVFWPHVRLSPLEIGLCWTRPELFKRVFSGNLWERKIWRVRVLMKPVSEQLTLEFEEALKRP